jgi:hypothetical protein
MQILFIFMFSFSKTTFQLAIKKAVHDAVTQIKF